MTTAERMYGAFQAVVTPPGRQIPPFARIDDYRKDVWEHRAKVFDRLTDYPLEKRLYRAAWTGLNVRPWVEIDGTTRLIWRLIAEQFTALDREVSAA